MPKWKVYISSTFSDLKDFRSELINLFQNQLKNNFELCEIMERMFDDGTYTPYVDDCIQAVLESDIYIIILGNKVGSFPPNEARTYTEIELDTALANDKRIFCLRLEHFEENDIDNSVKHDELLNKFLGRPIHSFNDSVDLKNALYEFLFPFSSQTRVNQKNPYKGLASFKVNDGGYFFSRDAELESCLKKIITSSGNFFASVIGNSGTGKSSFVMAGLLFRLKYKKELGFSERQQIIVTPASEPFTNLKYQMQLQGISVEDILDPNVGSPDLIIFFDQFEEVISQCHSTEAQEERKKLFEFLDALASNQNQNSKILVICTYRSDFLSQLANFDFIKSHQYIFPLSSLDYKVHTNNWEQSMTEIISKPALKNGVVIEKELVEQMLEQIKEVGGSLPILQLTLERIWNKETIANRRISSTEFNKLSEGKGISGFIETHAENVIKNITNKGKDKEREAILKTIFVNLVEVNENLNDVKRTVTKNELFSILKQHPEQIVNDIFETLVSEKSRLLNVNKEKDESINVGIIHEELIRKWERLKGWVNERRDALEYKKRITLDIAAFHKGERGLYGRKSLKRANLWKDQNLDLANEEINSFLEKSKKNNNRIIYKRTGISFSATVLILLMIFTIIQPYNKKKNFEVILKKNFPELYNYGNAVGGYKFINILTVDKANSSFLDENIKFFNNISYLVIDDSTFKDLTFIKNIKNPNSIKTLKISLNENLQNLEGIQALQSLTSLTINWNSRLESLSVIEALHSLTSLTISDNKNLQSLEGIQELKCLISLTISRNESLQSLEGVQALSSLASLMISDSDIQNLEYIQYLPSLESLIIFNNYELKNLEGLKALQSLNSLTISNNQNLECLEGIQALPSLTSLIISNNSDLQSLEGIQELQSLVSLEILENRTLHNLKGIQSLQSLNYLAISWNYFIENLKGLQNLQSLTSLKISGNDKLKSLEGIENLKSLTSLEISGNDKLKSLEGIENLKSLTSLEISRNSSLHNLKGIQELQCLNSFIISWGTSLHNIDSIKNLESLNKLELTYTDYTPELLYALKNLDTLIINEYTYLDLERIKHNNPGIDIVFK